MSLERLLVVSCGTVAMLVLMFLRRKQFPGIALWKLPIISILLAVCGVAGALLMHYIESGNFNGTSFFGAILFIPVLMLPVLLLGVPFSTLMDLCAPAESLMLAILRLDCMYHGCCRGVVLGMNGVRKIRFPSRGSELVVSLLIMLYLVHLEKNPKHKKKIYPYYLLLYGTIRFFLNWFRDGVSPFVWILPAGNFWSIVSICVAFLWLLILRKLDHNKT